MRELLLLPVVLLAVLLLVSGSLWLKAWIERRKRRRRAKHRLPPYFRN